MQTSENVIWTRLLSRVGKLSAGGISVGGSLTRVLRRCGKAGCRCAMEPSARHEAHLLTWKLKGKTQAAYVPVDMTEEVRQWTLERRRLKQILAEMDALVVALLKNHAAAGRARKNARNRLT